MSTQVMDEDKKIPETPLTAPVLTRDDGQINENGVFLAPYPGPRKTTTKKELAAYYLYFIGGNSLGPFIYANYMMQAVLNRAGFDPNATPYGEVACGAGQCAVIWAGKQYATSAVVLNIQGIAFAVQVVVFLLLGSLADFGSLRPFILMAWTLITAGSGLSWWALQYPSRWQILAGLFCIQSMGYQMCVSFASACLSPLARDLPEVQASEAEVAAGRKTLKEHRQLDMLKKNKVADFSYMFEGAGTVVILCINLGILHAMDYNSNRLKGYSALMVFTSALWLLLGIPWFIMEQKRPGRPLPEGKNYFTVVPYQLWEACKAIVKLKQAFMLMIAYFIITDTLTTNATVISTLTSRAINYSPFVLSAATIIGYAGQFISIGTIYIMQKRFKFSTKSIVIYACTVGMCLTIWGLIGLGTHKIGFRNKWEFFFYKAINGIGITPWYQVSRTLITEVVPPTHLFLFFCLFGVVGQTSSFIGPFITSRIINDKGGNSSWAFVFLFPMFVVGIGLLLCVNVKKAKDESTVFMHRSLEKDVKRVEHGKAEVIVV